MSGPCYTPGVTPPTVPDAQLRRHAYDFTLRTGVPPKIADLAHRLGAPASAVKEGLARLAAARVIVLQPSSGEILMVPPFSAVPTPFVVHTSSHTSFANCAWDALGVSVMMRQAVRIESACACCGDELVVNTALDDAPSGAALVHFAVPAHRWWEDIVFT